MSTEVSVDWRDVALERGLLVRNPGLPHHVLQLRCGEVRGPSTPAALYQLVLFVRDHGRTHGHEDHREILRLVTNKPHWANHSTATRNTWFNPDFSSPDLTRVDGQVIPQRRADLASWLRRQGFHDVEQLR